MKTNKIEILESLPGAGKTEVALEEIKTMPETSKIIWVTSTIEQLLETTNRATLKGLSVECFHSGDDEDSVASRVLDFLQNHDSFFIIITQVTYKRLLSTLTGNDLLVIDEEISLQTDTFTINGRASQQLYDYHFVENELNDKKVGVLTRSTNERYTSTDLTCSAAFEALYAPVSRSETSVFYRHRMSENGSHYIDYAAVPKLDYILKNARVLYMGHNLTNFLSTLIYKAISDVQFVTSPLASKLQLTNYKATTKVFYLFDDYLGNSGMNDLSEDHIQKIQTAIDQSVFSSDVLYVKQKNGLAKLNLDYTNSEAMSAKPEGLNKPEWMNKTNVVLLGNYYLEPSIKNLLIGLGIDVDQELTRHVPMLTQQLTRSKIRTNCSDEINLLVISQKTAKHLSELFSSSTITKLQTGITLKKYKRKEGSTLTEEQKTEINRLRAKHNYAQKKLKQSNTEQNRLEAIKAQEAYETARKEYKGK